MYVCVDRWRKVENNGTTAQVVATSGEEREAIAWMKTRIWKLMVRIARQL